MDNKLFKILGAILVVFGALVGVLVFLKKKKCCESFCDEEDCAEDAPVSQEETQEEAPAAPAEEAPEESAPEA